MYAKPAPRCPTVVSTVEAKRFKIFRKVTHDHDLRHANLFIAPQGHVPRCRYIRAPPQRPAPCCMDPEDVKWVSELIKQWRDANTTFQGGQAGQAVPLSVILPLVLLAFIQVINLATTLLGQRQHQAKVAELSKSVESLADASRDAGSSNPKRKDGPANV